ncbi:MAG: ParB/RepB/Spo0J family partition protein [Candidatus Aminicenantes bacterium]|nr:ParB/RepB/Spo0J family partition protein [Acidobacteriota bacterium]MCG2810884.1 ParB/RepB/Spo0J family partition protein [Candidatus Aminicenantes bacterium]
MPKKVGLPEFIKMKHDYHLVDEISLRTKTPVIRNIPIEKISANQMQPRRDMGDLAELTDSIRENGIIEPVIVRPKNGNFEIIAGERRFRAAKEAGMHEIPCIEHDIPDNEALEMSIIENIQRKDLNVFEQAQSIRSLAEIYGYTHEEIAKKIGKSRVTVTELVRINDLPEEIKQKCLELGIDSKTFLLELTKVEELEKMKAILRQYGQKPFSRDEIKQQRKKETQKNFNFNFVSDDKKVKINFHFKQEKVDRENVIAVLEKLIQDIKENKIKNLG